jgi:hypothetical protein
MYLARAKARAEDLYRLNGGQPTPCTIEEVEDLERWSGHRFPEAYREFLLWMGRSGGGFLRGSDCFYRHLKDLPSFAQELLEEGQFADNIPEHTFIFYMHQGYQFNFFYFDDGDDPPIYWYLEEIPVKARFLQLYAHFSEFILTEVEGHIRVVESLQLRNGQ